jgi:hypothetical protein
LVLTLPDNFVPPDATLADVTVQQDGKVLVSGFFTVAVGSPCFRTRSMFVARLDSRGRLDRSFADGGVAISGSADGAALAVQADGRVMVAGTAQGSPCRIFPTSVVVVRFLAQPADSPPVLRRIRPIGTRTLPRR